MTTYKNTTFCTYNNCEKWGDGKCSRSYTSLVAAKAQEWWGKLHPPVAVFDKRPECFERRTG